MNVFNRIDPNSAMPLFLQIVGQVESALRSKRVKPSQMLPSEPVLCEQFGVSRKTLRRATDHLTRLGLIRRIQGVGTIVTEDARVDGFSAVRSIYDNLMSTRRTPETKLLSAEGGIVDEVLSERTGFAVGAEVLFLARLRLADGRPIAVLENVVTSRISPIADVEMEGSFLELLKRRGLIGHLVRQELTAAFPSVDYARI